MYIYCCTHCVPLKFKRGFRSGQTEHYLSSALDGVKLKFFARILLEAGHRSVSAQRISSSYKTSMHRKNKMLHKANIFTIHFDFSRSSFRWVQGETKGGQGSNDLTQRSIECCCPHSYHILGTYTLIHSQTHHHNRI